MNTSELNRSQGHPFGDSLGISVSSCVAYFLLLSLSAYAFSIFSMHFAGPKAPLIGLRSIFEPRYLANWWFFRDARVVLNEGYSKVF